MNCAVLHCGRDRAPRFAQVPAIVEFAAAKMRSELDERVPEVLRQDMMEPEFLQARRVNDVAGRIEVVEPRVRRGVASAAKRCR